MGSPVMRAVVVEEPGGTEKLVMRDVAVPSVGAGEVEIEVAYAGVNWGDLQKRAGIYPDPVTYPAVIGLEISGRIAAVGRNVRSFTSGDRVAAITGPKMLGGYAERCVVPASYVMKLPAEIGLDAGAALPTASLTAWHLLNTASAPAEGDTILIHAIGGAVGLMLTQFARRKGLDVIGTVGSSAKAALPLSYGARHVIDRSQSDFVAETIRLTGAAGVDLVIDSLGAEFLESSFDCLRPFGRVINIGEAGGYPNFDIRAKLYERSTSLAGFEFLHANPGSPAWERSVADILSAFARREVELPVDAVYPLARAADAHDRLASRQVSGKLLLEVNAGL